MTNLYPNFNFLRLHCTFCKCDLITKIDLKKLSEQIVYECSDLKKEHIRFLNYCFKCDNCQKINSRNLNVWRVNNILFVD